ncbi:MAG: DUF2298 domain-containing protein [Thermoflexales bacterium]
MIGLPRRPAAWRSAVLLLTLAVALLLRTHDLNWDQSHNLHPDERYIAVLAGLLSPPSDVRAYFDSGSSPLNPFNTDWGRAYVYGTLPLFIGRYLGEFFDQGCEPMRALLPRLISTVALGDYARNCRQGEFISFGLLTLVGRWMSALADTLTVLVVYWLGRRLMGWRVGLLAAVLATFTALHIQQAHYFTVDATANLFVALSIYFATGALKPPTTMPQAIARVGSLALAGLTAGLALASKISTWPIGLLLALCALIMLQRSQAQWGRALAAVVSGLVLAGACAFAAFRVAQPYAFVGLSTAEAELTAQACLGLPEGGLRLVCQVGVGLPSPLREVFTPSARWLQQLQLAQGFVNGTIDAPFGIQWAHRMPVVFPLVNIVFWGMGVPLAAVALGGLAYAARQLARGRRWWVLLPVLAWTVGYFLYQGTQWTKSIRYLLPIYPFLAILAAYGAWAAWLRWRSRLLRALPAAIGTAGAVVWTYAFLHIYEGEITRVEASRWMYAHVPTALTAQWEHHAPPAQLPVRELTLAEGAPPQAVPLPAEFSQAAHDGTLRLTLNHLTGSALVEARLREMASGETVGLARGQVNAEQPHLFFGAVRLAPQQRYFVELTALSGGPLRARTSVIANEHWDDALPQRLDGRDPFGSYYRGLSASSDGQMQNYNDDTPEKLLHMLDWLDEADYIALSSNRLYASIPRLPWRYPMTTRYYRALFSGELGFELAADFHRFPRLGPLVFNSQEMPQLLVRTPRTAGTPLGFMLPYPPAEEAYSVYDHPRVLIFRKTPRYNRARAEALLGAADFSVMRRQSPRDAANAPGGLLLDDLTLRDQQAGGTWSELFPASSPLNRSELLAVLAWMALTHALGVAAFMLYVALARPLVTSRLQAHLPIGALGLALAFTLGFALVAWTTWLMASARLAPFTRPVIWAVIGTVLIAGALVGHLHRELVFAILRRDRWAMLAAEAVFICSFVCFLLIRAGNPDLWHPYMGGEKPMDFAYFNSVLRATWFPPQDPWFAGGYINYYYFGWVLVGAPVKALGITPAVAYNIIIPTLFGMVAVGAFGLGMACYAAARGAVASRAGILAAGLCAMAFVAYLGNGDEIRVVGPAWEKLGGIEEGTPAPLALLNGFVRWLGGAPLPIYPNWPYWNPTRPSPEVWIAEFPLFTFLYADLHAHMMAMPLVYLALGLALMFALGNINIPTVALGAGVVGLLWATNSWDYPTLLLVGLAGLWLGKLDQLGGKLSPRSAALAAWHAVPWGLAFVALGRAAIVPYLAHFGSAYNEVIPWENERTQINTYLTIYGLFILPLAAWLVVQHLQHASGRAALLLALVAGGVIALAGVPTALLSVPLLALSLRAALRPGVQPSGERLLWLLAGGAWGLTLFVELFVLRGDVARMNTVFKFYIQAWLILGVAAGVALVRVSAWLRDLAAPSPLARLARSGFFGSVGVATFLAALYPAFAIPAKINDRYTHDAPRGLDGMAFMRFAERLEAVNEIVYRFPLRDDEEAIRWLQQHVSGSPTILEGTTGGALYRWGNRFSIYTGLPAVIGWQWHQRQQRAVLGDHVVYARDSDVSLFYRTDNLDVARQLLRRYQPRYVILGELERIYYGAQGLAKFDALLQNGELRITWRNERVTIYEVADLALPGEAITASPGYDQRFQQ